MPTLELKPTHKAESAYYDSLAEFARLGIKHEGAVRSAFQELLESCARQFDWKLVPEYRIKRKGQADASADGALLDNYGLNHGLWEAKDSADDLDKEIKHKFSIGQQQRLSRQPFLRWCSPALGQGLRLDLRPRPRRQRAEKPQTLRHDPQRFRYSGRREHQCFCSQTQIKVVNCQP